MPIDPALVPLLDMINTLPHMNPPFDAAAFRLADEQPMPAFKADIAEVRDVTLDTAAGPVRARLYHPAPGETLPLLFFIFKDFPDSFTDCLDYCRFPSTRGTLNQSNIWCVNG